MTPRRRDADIVDIEAAWRQIGEEEAKEVMVRYHQLDEPLGRAVWSFGLWVAFVTHTTTN